MKKPRLSYRIFLGEFESFHFGGSEISWKFGLLMFSDVFLCATNFTLGFTVKSEAS